MILIAPNRSRWRPEHSKLRRFSAPGTVFFRSLPGGVVMAAPRTGSR